VDELELEKLREASGLRLDKEGRFWHRGEPVEHERTISVLHRGIHRAPDGRWATRIGHEWGYLEVEDAALFVQQLSVADGSLRGQLLTGEWVEISELSHGADDALYTRVRGERARLSRPAQASLMPWLHEEAGTYFLDANGARVAIGTDRGPEPQRDDPAKMRT
jgi:hypothetical protein